MRISMCLAVLVLMTGLVTGCGQKGPLVRPQEPAPAAVPADDDADNR